MQRQLLNENRLVHTKNEHIHVPKGRDQVEEVPSKEFKSGNTTIIIHSKLVHMSSEERRAWYESEWEKGNPVLKDIVEKVRDCLESIKET